MKKVLPALLLVIASSCYSQATKPVKFNWQTCLLKGKVRSTTEFNYKQFDSTKTSYPWTENYKFDSSGNCIDRIYFLKSGTLGAHYVYQYDMAGNNIDYRELKEDGGLKYKMHYKYDKQGNQVVAINYNSRGQEDGTDEYSYDKQGNAVVWRHKAGKYFTETYTYVYDALNRPVSIKSVSTTGANNNMETRYVADTVEESWKGTFSKGHTKTVYDKNKQLLWRKSLSGGFEDSFKYDNAGNKIEVTQTKNGVLLGAPHSVRIEYVYDDKGNWIKRTTTALDGKLLSSIERKIEYY